VGWTDWDLAERLAFMRFSASDMVLGFFGFEISLYFRGWVFDVGLLGGIYFK
jgi:hypothetical protein